MMNHDGESVDFHKDLKTRGCPVCNYINEVVLDFFFQWISAFANHEAVQEEYAAALGFCPAHTWQLESIASPRGFSAGYSKLLERLAGKLSDLTGSPAHLAEGVERLIKRDHCSVCVLMRDAEKSYIEQLAIFLRKKEGRDSYGRSQGVCLRHLASLLSVLSDEETSKYLLSQAAHRFNEAAKDMKSYVVKYAALERHLLTRNEKDAWSRAMIHVAGLKWIIAPN
ncbi:MAG: hypothetical protein JW884_10520 [Deltaproteobacteria bacterium]|nr:hypothetical protein [Deltaproteobacteria bacterium]